MDYGIFDLILNVGSVLALLAGGVVYYKSALSTNTLRLYKENQEAQNTRLESMGTQLDESRLEMTRMAEEIRVIKTLPLDTIMATLNAVLKSQNTILETQNKILTQLEHGPTVAITNNSPVHPN